MDSYQTHCYLKLGGNSTTISCKSCKDILSKQKCSSSRVVRMAWSVVSLTESKEDKRFISNLEWHCLVWDYLNLFLHGPGALLPQMSCLCVWLFASNKLSNKPVFFAAVHCGQWTLRPCQLLLRSVPGKATHRTNCPQMASKKWLGGLPLQRSFYLLVRCAPRAELQARFWDNCKWQTCHSWFATR